MKGGTFAFSIVCFVPAPRRIQGLGWPHSCWLSEQNRWVKLFPAVEHSLYFLQHRRCLMIDPLPRWSLTQWWLWAGGLSFLPCGPSPWAAWVPSQHGGQLPPVNNPREREQGGSHSAFYDRALEVTYHHFHQILFVRSESPSLAHRERRGVGLDVLKGESVSFLGLL